MPWLVSLAVVASCLLAQAEDGVQAYAARDTLQIAAGRAAGRPGLLGRPGLDSPAAFTVTCTGSPHASVATPRAVPFAAAHRRRPQ